MLLNISPVVLLPDNLTFRLSRDDPVLLQSRGVQVGGRFVFSGERRLLLGLPVLQRHHAGQARLSALTRQVRSTIMHVSHELDP